LRHIMIDIETLGTKATSSILSIGACEFNINTGKIGETFHTRIDIDSCLKKGLTVDGNTIGWWMEQDDEARHSLFDGHIRTLEDALLGLIAFIQPGDVIWANGSNFDIPILENALSACSFNIPWSYFNVRDYRTLVKMVPKEQFESIRTRAELKHNALSDAEAQALSLCAVIHWLESADAFKLAA